MKENIVRWNLSMFPDKLYLSLKIGASLLFPRVPPWACDWLLICRSPSTALIMPFEAISLPQSQNISLGESTSLFFKSLDEKWSRVPSLSWEGSWQYLTWWQEWFDTQSEIIQPILFIYGVICSQSTTWEIWAFIHPWIAPSKPLEKFFLIQGSWHSHGGKELNTWNTDHFTFCCHSYFTRSSFSK